MNALSGDFSVSEDVEDADLELHVARDERAFLALEQHWTNLERVAAAKAFFQSFEWSRKAIEHKRTEDDPNLFICCVFASGTLVGLLPLAFWKKGRRIVLTGLAEPFQFYTEMLAAPGYSPAALYRKMHGEIRRSGADYLHLGQIRRFGPLSRAVRGLVPASGQPEAEPFADRRDWRSCEDVGKALEQLQDYGTRDHPGQSSRAIGDCDLGPADCRAPAASRQRAGAADEQLVQDHVLALSPLGRLYCGLWLGYVRPLAKWIRINLTGSRRSTADIPVPRR